MSRRAVLGAVVLSSLLGGGVRSDSTARALLTDYLPLGSRVKWLFVDPTHPSDTLRMAVTQVADDGHVAQIELALGTLGGRLLLRVINGRLELDGLAVTARDLSRRGLDIPVSLDLPSQIDLRPRAALGGPEIIADDPQSTAVAAVFDVGVSVGPIPIDVPVHVDATVTATWSEEGSVDGAFLGRFPSVVALTTNLSARVRASEASFKVDGHFDETVRCLMARSVGCVQIEVGGRTYHLKRAILPERILGDFETTPDLERLTVRLPAVTLAVRARAGASADDGRYLWRDVSVTHDLTGRATLSGALTPSTDPAGGGNVRLGARVRAQRSGTALLAGHARWAVPGLTKPLLAKVRAVLDPTTTTVAITYRGAGGIAGTLAVPIHVASGNTLRVDVDGLLDQQLTGSGPVRRLASGGRLMLGDTELPVDVTEIAKTRRDGTTQRRYAVTLVGSHHATIRLTASSSPSGSTIVPTLARTTLNGRGGRLHADALALVGP